jgi:phosphate transport system protein
MRAMTRLPYQEELQRLQTAVVDELGQVSSQLARVLELLESGAPEIGDAVIAGDDEVDRRYRALQTDLVTVIARQAPVASDLRLITALLHISRMIERMGDQCVNIAKLISVAGPRPAGTEAFHACLLSMARETDAAVHAAGSALRDEDVGAATALEDADSVVDDLNRACFTHAITLGDAEDRRTWATAMILVSRALERIADNAVDIGAHLRFAVTGTFEARAVPPVA